MNTKTIKDTRLNYCTVIVSNETIDIYETLIITISKMNTIGNVYILFNLISYSYNLIEKIFMFLSIYLTKRFQMLLFIYLIILHVSHSIIYIFYTSLLTSTAQLPRENFGSTYWVSRNYLKYIQ